VTVLVDCRPLAAYASGHLPEAVHLDPERDLSAPPDDPAVGGRHPLPDAGTLAAAFGAAGIDSSTFVLAYDEGTGWAARCWWLLRHLGHDGCGTFDLRSYVGARRRGGAESACVGEQALSAPRASPVTFIPRVRTDDVIEADEIRARLEDPSFVLYDARSPERWRGDAEPLDPVAGRIPGARNAFFEEPLPTGATDGATLVAYCGSGVTACVVLQRLVAAGREDARLYPGSFSEWCRNPSNPIERGDA
jgi:thiosulfate/3-mercaptopyruvate sulfurtransferase